MKGSALLAPLVLASLVPVPASPQSLEPSASAAVSCYSSLTSGQPLTLFASIIGQNAVTGMVEVNGGDSQQPSTPFKFAWGDGQTTSGFFPQQHTYGNAARNYAISITATENNGSVQQISVPLFFVSPAITRKASKGISFEIPSSVVVLNSHWPSYAPPADVAPFASTSFPFYTRADVTNIMEAITSIDYIFANKKSFLLNGQFSIVMLMGTDYSDAVSYWFTTPMAVGYGSNLLTPPVWYILFNEVGKDTTLNTPTTLTYGGHTDGNASEIYSETMGDIFSYASGCQLVSNPSTYGLDPAAAADIRNNMLSGAENLQQAFNNYVSSGAVYSSWNPYNGQPDPTLGTISTLAWKFIQHAEQSGQGYQVPAQRMMHLLQLFNSTLLADYDPADNTASGSTFRATLMVAALSYAFSEDLRPEFAALNFPIDNPVFEQLYEMATGGGATLTPVSLSFSSAFGSTSSPKTVTLSNQLLTPITFSASLGGTNPNDFLVQPSSTCLGAGGTLGPLSSCTYVLAFRPSIKSSESAILSITETADDISEALPVSPQPVSLSGSVKK